MSNLKQFMLFILLATFLTRCISLKNSNSTEHSGICVISCPHYKYQKTEHLPTEVCQIKFTCTNCQKILTSKR